MTGNERTRRLEEMSWIRRFRHFPESTQPLTTVRSFKVKFPEQTRQGDKRKEDERKERDAWSVLAQVYTGLGFA